MNIVIAKTQKEITDNYMVRGKVFIVGQEIDWDIEFDGLDEECVLFTAYIDDIAVGAARLYKNKVGRVATLEEYRKQGIASKIMEAIEMYARNNGIKKVILNAQLYIKDFYMNLGYTPIGDIFQEADIDHIKMEKEL